MTVHLLGTGAGVSDPERTTTMLAFAHGATTVLVDCGGDAARALQRAGLAPETLSAVVLTHEHPDHISGFPLLIEKMWLLGRRDPIDVHGPAATLAIARKLFGLFDTTRWDGLPTLVWHPVELAEDAAVYERDGLRLRASPVNHPVPTIGLRAEADGAVVAYSCDTAPTPVLARLAQGADLLIHEATGHLPDVHCSVDEACDTAVEAGVETLVLVHAPIGAADQDLTRANARVGSVRWGADGERIDLAPAG